MKDLKEIQTEDLIQELLSRGFIRVLWNKDDIINTAFNLGVTLTDEQVDEVVDNIEHRFDANIGVNWNIIEYHIKNLVD